MFVITVCGSIKTIHNAKFSYLPVQCPKYWCPPLPELHERHVLFLLFCMQRELFKKPLPSLLELTVPPLGHYMV